MDASQAHSDPKYSADYLPVGTRLLGGQYVIERFLGSGGFGITYVARDSLDRQVVIKECFPEALCTRKNRTVMERSRTQQGQFHSIVEMFVREARSLAKLEHRNIVGVHQVFKDNETAYMALDLIPGQDLLDIIDGRSDRPPYKEVKSILFRLLDAIAVVHDEDMLHRDISPDNILIDVSGSPVLIDFGAAREEASKKSRALSAVQVVKDGYSPQEFYVAGSQQGAYSDLYALAATFYHVISGEPPINSQIRLAALAADKPDPIAPLAGRIEGYPKDFLAALDQAMSVFPKDRIQCARDWMGRIDERKGPTRPIPATKNARDIESTVTKLIAHAAKDAITAGPAPKPKPAPAPEPVANETKREDFKTRFAELAKPLEPDNTPRPVVEDTEPDWIEKARLKQQARVEAIEKAMEAEYAAMARAKSKPRALKSRVISAPTEGAPSVVPGVAAPKSSMWFTLMMVAGGLVVAVVLGLNGAKIADMISPGEAVPAASDQVRTLPEIEGTERL